VFTPQWRLAVEATIAEATGVAPEHVIVIVSEATRVPAGGALVKQSMRTPHQPAVSTRRTGRKHLFVGLWVFADPSLTDMQRAAVAPDEPGNCGGMPNLIETTTGGPAVGCGR
jgi:hypothetical protein